MEDPEKQYKRDMYLIAFGAIFGFCIAWVLSGLRYM